MLRLMVLTLLAGPVFGQALDDPHLPALPRSADEQDWIAALLAPVTDFSKPETFEESPAGSSTVPATMGADAFSHPSANLSVDREPDFTEGRALFRKTWIAAPATLIASDGLGPLYNARTCQECHLKDGRGHAPEGDEEARVSMFLRVSTPGGPAPAGITGWIATSPDPVYGGQLQDFASPGQVAEGRMNITWRQETLTLADGTTVALRAPAYSVSNLGYGPMHPEVMLSPRVAPQMIGLGLLEAIPVDEILSREDPEDADGDGISGRAQIVMSLEFGKPMLGRFGLKAGVPTVSEQVASALAGDMGLSTRFHPRPFGDCSAEQLACRDALHGQEPGIHDGYEVDNASLDLLTFYSRNLGVPARREVDDPTVLRGKAVFHQLNCSDCHTPKHVTHRLANPSEQSFQLIWPYTDLLLHDMGEGLADDRPEGRATGQEWRTPPLWGIGLTQAVSGHTEFLHDGRARTLLEAILWHGGEAQLARDGVVQLAAEDRAALIAFLESL